jgi:hypothetical protein
MNLGFPTLETQRLAACLARLVRHISRDDMALTGGVAIQLELAASAYSGARTLSADLDFVARHFDAIAPTVSSEFLVSHYHLPQPDVAKFMIQLVDPESHIRVDVFPDLAGSLRRAQWRTVGGHKLKVLALESILEHKLLTLSKASEATPVDPKHLDDAKLLAAFVGRNVPHVPSNALVTDVYGGAADLECRRCELSRHRDFPLAGKREIFDMLGWS